MNLLNQFKKNAFTLYNHFYKLKIAKTLNKKDL